MDSPSHLSWSGVEEWVLRLKNQVRPQIAAVSLEEATDWALDDHQMAPRSQSRYSIRQISAEMPGRERERWDQPILSGSAEGLVTLVCSVFGGMLHFLLRAHSGCGSFHGFDITALQVDPCPHSADVQDRRMLERIQELEHSGDARVLAASRFSDEGGRFLHTVSRYEVLQVSGDALRIVPDADEVWLTLGQFKALIDAGELVSSEARSVRSLLLRHL